jgi:hypothetical protein
LSQKKKRKRVTLEGSFANDVCGNGEEIGFGLTYDIGAFESQQAQENFLGEVVCFGGVAQARDEEPHQLAAVCSGQAFDEMKFGVLIHPARALIFERSYIYMCA